MDESLTTVEYKFNVKGQDLQKLEELALAKAKTFWGPEAFRMQIEAHNTPDAGDNSSWQYTAHVRSWRRRDYDS